VHNGAFEGDWAEFWSHVESYAPTGPDGKTPLQALIYELAALGDHALRSPPSCAADFYDQHYQLALAD
jgi:hypothetical protein